MLEILKNITLKKQKENPPEKKPNMIRDSYMAFDEYLKKQILPKDMRKLNPELLQLQSSKLAQATTEVSKEQKELIEMKYKLSKMTRKLKKD